MYVAPYSGAKSQTPQKYTNKARDEINRKLNLNAPQNLKYGSSPLKNVANASDTSLTKVNSVDSLESRESIESTGAKSKKSFFGSLNKLRHIGSSQSSLKQREEEEEEEDVQMQDNESQSIISESPVNQVPSLYTVPSIDSSYSNYSTSSSLKSRQSNTNNSLFSNQSSLATQFTNVSQYTTPLVYQPLQSNGQYSSKQIGITLQEALPTRFDDMYAPELLADPNLLIDGRPLFTRRALLDWDLNDIRSLLIVEKLKEEWNGQIPIIYSPQGFKIEYLPLDADDQAVIKTLVESDIYKEAKFDSSFRIQTAKYTLFTARRRHAQILKNSGLPDYYNTRFSKPEWRNVIENFLLNLAVEAQCRHDFKKVCHDLKKARKQQSQSSVPQAPLASHKNNLLRKAILNEASQTVKTPPSVNTSLTKEEKAQLWTDVQSKVYQRIGLDWTPDPVRT